MNVRENRRGNQEWTIQIEGQRWAQDTKWKRESANTGWLGITIMCPSGATGLSADLFQWASTIEFKLRVFVLYKADLIIIIPSKINLFMPWYSYKIAELALNNNYSLSVTQMLHVYWYLSSISDQVILFLTDGGFDEGRDPREVIRDENAKLQNRVIVFTYLLGPGMFVYFIYRAVVYRTPLSQSVE